MNNSFNIDDDVQFLNKDGIKLFGIIQRIDFENKQYRIRADNNPFIYWINFDDENLLRKQN